MPLLGAKGCDLVDLAKHLLTHGPEKVMATSRRVRIIHNHVCIVDTTSANLIWEHGYYPQLYVPAGDIQNCKVAEKTSVTANDAKGTAVVKLEIPGKDGNKDVTMDRTIRFGQGEKSAGQLAGLVRLEFGSVDTWLDEDIPIYVHPKDPFKRVDLLPSSRSVEVKVAGKTIAKSPNSVHLLETGLPTRYYLPLASVDMSVLRKSDTVTSCPYKGDANYYHVVVDGKQMNDLVWYYRLPTLECSGVAGLVCFYNEKVEIILDGKPMSSPKTHFS